MRTVVILLFALSILERTGISVVTVIVTKFNQIKTAGLLPFDTENEQKEKENIPDNFSKHPWTPCVAGTLNVCAPDGDNRLQIIADTPEYLSFYPTVQTPPPDLASS